MISVFRLSDFQISGSAISSRKNNHVELQTLLEKRYLCFLSWEKIAVEMHYSIQHIYRMHDEALSCVNAIMK